MGMLQVFTADDALFSSRITVSWEFPTGQVVKTLYSRIPQAMWLSQKKKNTDSKSQESLSCLAYIVLPPLGVGESPDSLSHTECTQERGLTPQTKAGVLSPIKGK